MFRYPFILILWLGPGAAGLGYAQTSLEGGARASALGGATTALSQNPSGHANPASWATLAGRAVTFYASEAFGLAALRLGAVTYIEPTGLGTFTAGLLGFGYEAYREVHALAGFARGFRLGSTRRFHLGLALRYQRIAIPLYGQTDALILGVGGLVAIRPSVQAGFQVLNLTPRTRSGRETYDRALAVGLAYAPDERALLVLDVYKAVRYPLSVRVGLEMHPVTALALRVGAATKPARFTAGAGVRLGTLAAEVAAERHEVLGWSPGLALGLRW